MPKTLLKLSMAVAVIAVGLAGGELLLRLRPESTLAFLGPANATYRIRTDELDGLVVTNDLGFREPVSFGPKAPGTLRIVTIGDSYTFGWGVNYDETYGQAMRRALARDEGIGNVEIVNISRGGAGHTDYIMFARDYAFRLDPDLIVVGFLFGNDSVFGTSGQSWGPDPATAYANARAYADSLLQPAQPAPGGSLRLLDLLAPLGTQVFWTKLLTAPEGFCDPVWNHPNALYTREQVIRLYGDASPELARYDRLAAEGFLDKARRCEIMPYRINGAIATPNYWPDILGVNPQTRPFNEALWQLAHEGMQEIARMGEQHGVPVFIAGLPPAYSADPAALSEAARLGTALPPELLTDTAVSDRFLEFCSRAAIHCASYLGPIREAMAHADADLYFPMDAHMSPRGNEVLGTLIAHDVAPFLRH